LSMTVARNRRPNDAKVTAPGTAVGCTRGAGVGCTNGAGRWMGRNPPWATGVEEAPAVTEGAALP